MKTRRGRASVEEEEKEGCAREKEDIRKGCAPEGGGQVDMKERQGEWEERQKKRLSNGWGV